LIRSSAAAFAASLPRFTSAGAPAAPFQRNSTCRSPAAGAAGGFFGTRTSYPSAPFASAQSHARSRYTASGVSLCPAPSTTQSERRFASFFNWFWTGFALLKLGSSVPRNTQTRVVSWRLSGTSGAAHVSTPAKSDGSAAYAASDIVPPAEWPKRTTCAGSMPLFFTTHFATSAM
jgi:hypothetical protein